jgi:chemotaxis protein MotA
MDIATGLGILGGFATIFVLIMIDGGNFAAFFDKHAVIIIFGGRTSATMTRFPFSVIAHGLPMGMKYGFGGPLHAPPRADREFAEIAELMRKGGPMALENVPIRIRSGAGVRYLVDGYDQGFYSGHDGEGPRQLPAAARGRLEGLPRLWRLRPGLGA